MDIKLTIGQLLGFFVQLQQFFSYVKDIPVIYHFSLLLIDRYILTIQQVITHKEQLQYFFWAAAIFCTSSEALARWS